MMNPIFYHRGGEISSAYMLSEGKHGEYSGVNVYNQRYFI